MFCKMCINLNSRVKPGFITQHGLSDRLSYIGFIVQCFCMMEFMGVIDDPLLENMGVIGKFRGSELFLCIITSFVCACIDIKGI